MPDSSSSVPADLPSGTHAEAATQAQPLILVVDDDADMRRFMARFLGASGYAVCVAPTASEAFARVAEGEEGVAPPIDLVLTDLRLDCTSGLELVAALRGIAAHAVVLLSSRVLSSDQRELAALYGAALMDAPFTPAALRGAVAELLTPEASAA